MLRKIRVRARQGENENRRETPSMKGRKMGLEAGDEKFPQSQAGIHESRAVFLNYYAKEVAGGQGQDRLKCGPSLRSHSSGISHKEATQGLLSALTGK